MFVLWFVAAARGEEVDCHCVVGLGYAVTPADGAADVPRNTRIRVSEYGVDGDIPELHVGVDGVEVDVEFRRLEGGGYGLLDAWLPEGWPPGATVTAWADEGQLLAFQVGDTSDTSAPAWDGAYTVESVAEGPFESPCTEDGLDGRHEFTFEGLSDDVTPAEDLLIWAEPVDVGEPFLDFGSTLGITYSECVHTDPTLLTQFQRSYDVYVEDAAGNRSGPFRVVSGDDAWAPDEDNGEADCCKDDGDEDPEGCGCAHPGGAGSAVAFALSTLGALRRRRIRG